MKKKTQLKFKEAIRLWRQGRNFIRKTLSGNLLHFREHWAGDVHLISKPFAHKTMPLRRKQIIFAEAGYKYTTDKYGNVSIT